jgi:hypothetical protein
VDPIIRLAREDDRAALIRFLDEHWKPNHILVQSRALFDWQHLSSAHPGQLNFVLALDSTSQDILAVLGFLPISQFSLREDWSETFLVVWKVRDDVRRPGLGIGLLNFLIRQTQPALVGAVGLSRMVVPIYRALGYQIGQLDHHVLFNPRRSAFSIASGVEPRHLPLPVPVAAATSCIPLNNASPCSAILEALCASFVSRKTWEYVRRRYLQHPIYRYHVLGLFQDGEPRAILIARKVQANGSAVLRIADFLGDAAILPLVRGALQSFLVSENAEYIDIYQHGIPGELFTAAGFVNRRQEPALTVPNYFEPFEAANVELDFAYKLYDPSLAGRVRIFRGDTDQDRPNQLPQTITETDIE